MSVNQIEKWIDERNGLNCRRDYFDLGNRTQHIIRYDNGDVYQHLEIYKDMFHKTIETILNGVTVRKCTMVYVAFGWKEV